MATGRLHVALVGAAWLVTGLLGCGPSSRDQGDLPDAGPVTCVPTSATESCSNQIDDDCDNAIDCADTDCSGIGGCPVSSNNCEVQTPSVSLPLPDGDCLDDTNPTPATCSNYTVDINLTGFTAGAMLTDTSGLLGLCVTIEHSWFRDLQIEALCPEGNTVVLDKFFERVPQVVYLGMPNQSDNTPPVPGVGAEYCWKSTATNPPMPDYATANDGDLGDPPELPPGDYQPSEPFAGFQGCSLNGTWKLRVIDLWGQDDGFVFGTRMLFDPSLTGNTCPVIE